MTSTTPYHKDFKFKVEPNWKTDQNIGSGAFGIVFLERIRRSGRSTAELCAVKKIPTGNPAFPRKRFEAEIENLSRVASHQWFVQLFGWNEDQHYVYIAMEYIELGDLGSHIKEKWTECDTKVVASQLLQGLKAMHEAGIIHRDLKPENIFPVLLDDQLQVKIGDFGISKRVSNDNSTILQTNAGTPGYMAPEILDSPNHYTDAIDYWSLGCVLYKMVAGKTPFTAREIMNYRYMDVDFPRSLLDSVSLSEAGINFIKGLVNVKPACRLEATLKSGWIQTELSCQVTRELCIRFEEFLQQRGSRADDVVIENEPTPPDAERERPIWKVPIWKVSYGADDLDWTDASRP